MAKVRSFMQIKSSYIEKSSEKKKLIKKTLSHLAGLAHLSRFIWAGALVYFSYEHIIFFYKSFVKTMTSHLGETAHLTGPVHLHTNSPKENTWNKSSIQGLQYEPRNLEIDHFQWSFRASYNFQEADLWPS